MAAPCYFTAVSGSKVNRESGIIEGVSVITSGVEAKGHGVFIDSETLNQVKACAETYSDGVHVKVDHGTGFTSIVGALRNFRIKGNKLLADIHLLKSHEMRDQLFEIAETMPASIGLSISFSGKNEEIGGKEYARCVELYSVDFVDRPAANPSGLFNRVDSPEKGMSQERSFLEKLKDFISGAEKELAPINFEAKANELEAKVKELGAKLVEKDKALTDATIASSAAFEKIKSEYAEKEKNLDAEIEKQASAKALQITAGQGQPPITKAPTATPGAPERADFSKLFGIQKFIAIEKYEAANKGK